MYHCEFKEVVRLEFELDFVAEFSSQRVNFLGAFKPKRNRSTTFAFYAWYSRNKTG